MTKPINVLIVEDEPLILTTLQRAFDCVSNSSKKWNFKLITARDCDSARLKINKAERGLAFDLALLDINIPPSADKKLLSGEDLGIELRALFRDIKIVVFASHNQRFRVNNILQSVKPNGLLIKTEIEFNDLVRSIKVVLKGSPIYSKGVLQSIRMQISNKFTLDRIDRLLLFQLSLGTKTKDMPKLIGLSKGGIESRKRRLKELFCLDNANDADLLKAARDMGYV